MPLLLTTMLACNESSFKGESAKSAPEAEEPEIVEEEDPCIPDEGPFITSAELLSDTIALAPIEKSIFYRIGLKDCDGNVQDLVDTPILFDLNTIVVPFNVPTPYRILKDNDDRDVLVSGDFTSVHGSDLFGNQGEYAYWKSENIGVENPEVTIILEVILDNIELKPRTDIPETKKSEIPSYLKVMDAKTVQTNIGFKD